VCDTWYVWYLKIVSQNDDFIVAYGLEFDYTNLSGLFAYSDTQVATQCNTELVNTVYHIVHS